MRYARAARASVLETHALEADAKVGSQKGCAIRRGPGKPLVAGQSRGSVRSARSRKPFPRGGLVLAPAGRPAHTPERLNIEWIAGDGIVLGNGQSYESASTGIKLRGGIADLFGRGEAVIDPAAFTASAFGFKALASVAPKPEVHERSAPVYSERTVPCEDIPMS